MKTKDAYNQILDSYLNAAKNKNRYSFAINTPKKSINLWSRLHGYSHKYNDHMGITFVTLTKIYS